MNHQNSRSRRASKAVCVKIKSKTLHACWSWRERWTVFIDPVHFFSKMQQKFASFHVSIKRQHVVYGVILSLNMDTCRSCAVNNWINFFSPLANFLPFSRVQVANSSRFHFRWRIEIHEFTTNLLRTFEAIKGNSRYANQMWLRFFFQQMKLFKVLKKFSSNNADSLVVKGRWQTR